MLPGWKITRQRKRKDKWARMSRTLTSKGSRERQSRLNVGTEGDEEIRVTPGFLHPER